MYRKIGIVVITGPSVGAARKKALRDLATSCVKQLNSSAEKNSPFEFTFVPTELVPRVPPDATVDNRGYEDKWYWDAFSSVSMDDHFGYIGLTPEFMQVGSFNRQNYEEHLGLVSIAEYSAFLPAGQSLEDFVCYLILAAAVMIAADLGPSGKHLKEHPAHEKCLLDLCEVRTELKAGLGKATVRHCAGRMRVHGYSADEVDAVERALRVIRRKSVFLFFSSLGLPGVAFLTGIALSFVASVTATVSLRAGVVLTAVIASAGLGLALSVAVRAKGVEGMVLKRWRFLAGGIGLLLTLLLVYLGLTVSLPRKDTYVCGQAASVGGARLQAKPCAANSSK